MDSVQEQLQKAKYGGLLPKKKLLAKEHKFFDSADWAMKKQGQKPEANVPVGPSHLEPKWRPDNAAPRRGSNLGDKR